MVTTALPGMLTALLETRSDRDRKLTLIDGWDGGVISAARGQLAVHRCIGILPSRSSEHEGDVRVVALECEL